MRGRVLLGIGALLLVLVFGPVQAQEISGNFGAGSVKIGPDTRACTATLDGALRYTPGSLELEYCDSQCWHSVRYKKPTSAGLVGWWKLDETSGATAANAAGTPNGTTSGGPTWGAGRISNALTFDGVNDVLTIPSTSALATSYYTVSLWVKPGALNTSALFEHSRYSQNWYGIFIVSPGRIHMRITDYDTLETSAAVLKTGSWQHIAVTFNGIDAIIYLNGVVVQSGTYSHVESPSANTTTIGSNADNERYTGAIDDIRVFNRALSPAEILTIYNGCTS